jgi:hypothetical protein
MVIHRLLQYTTIKEGTVCPLLEFGYYKNKGSKIILVKKVIKVQEFFTPPYFLGQSSFMKRRKVKTRGMRC